MATKADTPEVMDTIPGQSAEDQRLDQTGPSADKHQKQPPTGSVVVEEPSEEPNVIERAEEPYRDILQVYGRGARPKVHTEEGIQYEREIKTANLSKAIRRWRRLAGHFESNITDIYDEQALKQERQSLVTIIEEIYDTHESLTSLYPQGEFPFPELDETERNHVDLIRRINARLSEISSETRLRTSRKSKSSSKRSVRTTRSIRTEAAAKAAQLETELKYLKPLQEQEAALKARKADITRLKLEKELHVAKARLKAVS